MRNALAEGRPPGVRADGSRAVYQHPALTSTLALAAVGSLACSSSSSVSPKLRQSNSHVGDFVDLHVHNAAARPLPIVMGQLPVDQTLQRA